MADNGRIVIDLNRITRREFREFIARLIDSDEKTEEADLLTGELAEKVIISWNYEQPITQDGYMSLGLKDSQDVDKALRTELGLIAEKN